MREVNIYLETRDVNVILLKLLRNVNFKTRKDGRVTQLETLREACSISPSLLFVKFLGFVLLELLIIAFCSLHCLRAHQLMMTLQI